MEEGKLFNGIGIDVGIKHFIVTSRGEFYKNISGASEIRKLHFRINKLRNELRRKIRKNNIVLEEEDGEDVYSFVETNNMKKISERLTKVKNKIRNIRRNHLYYILSEILKKGKPEYITIEDIDIEEITLNKSLPQEILIEDFKEFYNILKERCKKENIELRVVKKDFPSSKICCKCGKINKELSIRDRKFKCSCGNIMDRDLNAAINLLMAEEYRIIK